MQEISNNDEKQIEQLINDSIINNGSNSKTPILLSDHSTNYSKNVNSLGKIPTNIIRSYTQYSENILGKSIEKPKIEQLSSKGSTKKNVKLNKK